MLTYPDKSPSEITEHIRSLMSCAQRVYRVKKDVIDRMVLILYTHDVSLNFIEDNFSTSMVKIRAVANDTESRFYRHSYVQEIISCCDMCSDLAEEVWPYLVQLSLSNNPPAEWRS